MRVVQERSRNIPTVTYTRGLDLSGGLEGAGGIGGLLARTDQAQINPVHAYYHADGNGNVTAMVDAQGQIAARYSYDPYGNVLGMSGPLAEANLYRFSSKEAHPASGLVYYLYRFYDPNLQRWVNRDPIGERASVNYYAFLHSSPLAMVDAFGLQKYVPETSFDECVHNCRYDYLHEDLGIASRTGRSVSTRLGKGVILCGAGLAIARWLPTYGKGLEPVMNFCERGFVA